MWLQAITDMIPCAQGAHVHTCAVECTPIAARHICMIESNLDASGRHLLCTQTYVYVYLACPNRMAMRIGKCKSQ